MLSLFRIKDVKQFISWIVLIAFLNLIHGCHFYYKVNKSAEPPGPALIKFQDDYKFIILHNADSVWKFKNIVVDEDTIRGTITKLVDHNKYKTTNPERSNRYKKSSKINESEVLNEVHIYMTESTQPSDTLISIPTAAIDKIELYDPAKGATVASWIFGGLGIGALAFAVVIIIVALTKESCPFIYVSDGSSFKFIGEIYSGAIYPSVERHDYLPLPAPNPGQKDYTIKMTNEVHEIQHTNLIELNVFDHPAGTDVLVDKYGNYNTTGNLETPIEATNLKGKNILDIIKEKDTLSYFGEVLVKDPALTDGIILKFNRPQNTNVAKLKVKARNTFWLDYTFARFHELFGKEYDCWVDKQTTVPTKKMKNWMLDQNIPLSLYIEKNGRWQFVDYYNVVGPMAAKEDILSVDISDIDSDYIRMKLEFGFLFWEVDYAAIDYTVNVPVTHRIAQFESAVDNKDQDVRNLLTSSDLLYYVQPEIGNAVNMKFSIPEPTDAKQTLILHSKGYYKVLMNLTGEEQIKYLLSFRKKGRLPEFSSELFQKQSGMIPN